jgi:hypothetical protein
MHYGSIEHLPKIKDDELFNIGCQSSNTGPTSFKLRDLGHDP